MSIEAAFSQFPQLVTQRMILREARAEDAQGLYEVKSDSEITHRYGQEPHRTVDDTLDKLRRLQIDYQQRDALFWAMTLKGEDRIIGGIVYWNFGPGFHTAEIGYELHPAYWRQGLMAEGLRAVLDYGFNELGLNRVEATPFADNEPSCKFLAKVGFRYEGNLRQRYFFRGRFLDQLYFGLLAEEWQKAA